MSSAGAYLRSVVLGIVLGVAPLLLLDLAIQLRGGTTPASTTAWWVAAVYALVGAVVAAAVIRARRDPLIPGVAALVLAFAVAPGLPSPLSAMPQLPVIGAAALTEAPVVVVLAAICAVGAVRGRGA